MALILICGSTATLLLGLNGSTSTYPRHLKPVSGIPVLNSKKPTDAKPQRKQYDSLSAAIAAARYSWQRSGAASAHAAAVENYETFNQHQQLRAQLDENGLHVRSAFTDKGAAEWKTVMRLADYGYGEIRQALSAASKYALNDNRIEASILPSDGSGPGLTEWYINRPEGIEQGFTLHAPPAKHRTSLHKLEPLRLKLKLLGDLHAQMSRDNESIELRDANRETVLHYGKLMAQDATGRTLAAQMGIADEGAGIFLLVHDQAAVYPLTIDPLITQPEAKLTPKIGYLGAEDHFGTALAMSSDTAVVGAPAVDSVSSTNPSAVYLFIKNGATWSLAQKLIASDAAPTALFGSAVAISQDILVVAAPGDDTAAGQNAGSVYVFTRANGVWTESQKLVASDGGVNGHFGQSVAIDGSAIGVGAPSSGGSGAAYVFDNNGTGWTERKKFVSDSGGQEFGASVSISGSSIAVVQRSFGTAAYVFIRNGFDWTKQAKIDIPGATSVRLLNDTLVVGARGGFGGPGTGVYIYTRAGSTWTFKQSFDWNDANGQSVDYNGSTIVVGDAGGILAGAPDKFGAVHVYTLNNGTWAPAQTVLASDGAIDDEFGFSAAVSSTDEIMVGARYHDPPAGTDAGSAYVFTRNNGTWNETQKLDPSFNYETAYAQLGSAVAIEGDTAVVGAFGENAAYVFKRSGTSWAFQQKLFSPETGSFGGGAFGVSAALDGNTLAIGAYRADGNNNVAGAAFIYVFDGANWVLQQKVFAGDGDYGDDFGYSLDLDGDTLAVGAWRQPLGTHRGAAYVFTRSGTAWTQQQKLIASDGEAQDYFGGSVGISGSTIVVGAPFHNAPDLPGQNDAGAAYIFEYSGGVWAEQQLILSLDHEGGDFFGASVGIWGDTIAVGAYHDDTPPAYDGGSAYVFTRGGGLWTQQQKLIAPDAKLGDEFGWSVALDADNIVVGAYLHRNTAGLYTGSVYVFARTGSNWSLNQQIQANDAANFDYFGNSVAVSGDTVLIGAMLADANGITDAGAAYVYRVLPMTTPGPIISSFLPASGLPGAGVTILGSGFTGTTAVSFNGVAAAFTVDSDTEINAVVPTGASTGSITVTGPNGSGISPTNFIVLVDSDSDGMSNDFEQQYFGNPTAAPPGDDSDGDGETNLEEFRAGTDPLDSQSVFRITEIRREGNDMVIVFPALAGKRYQVEATADLGTNFPILIVTVPRSALGYTAEVTDPDGVVNAPRYYRIVVLP